MAVLNKIIEDRVDPNEAVVWRRIGGCLLGIVMAAADSSSERCDGKKNCYKSMLGLHEDSSKVGVRFPPETNIRR